MKQRRLAVRMLRVEVGAEAGAEAEAVVVAVEEHYNCSGN